MKKVNFLFGIHNHQPVGNFQSVFQESFDKAYLPFLELLESYPKIRTTMHFSGILLKWISDHRPEGIDILKKLVAGGQLEIMTGGFYEPILSIIPDRDKIGQIRKLTHYIERAIGDFPCGMWLAERIWEPHLPAILRKAGVKYTVLDDAHFRYSGLTDEQLNGYYLTEEVGETIALFPISRFLRYAIPFKPVENTIEHLRELSDEHGRVLAIYADDGEKFGVWPGTYKSCYGEKWLERFFAALSENSGWINMLHFREALEKIEALGRVYLPTASYTEMNEWALPARAIKRYEEFGEKLKAAGIDEEYAVFVRGGFWRNFLAKYPESNNMHKRMLQVSEAIARLRSGGGASEPELSEAEDYLWRGQCNCPYWHGVFGGLYLPHIRAAVYQNLIMAEKIIDGIIRKKAAWTEVEQFDLDRDGKDELIVRSPDLSFFFSPSAGAALFELDYKPANLNLIDCITRREEGYHGKITSTGGGKSDGETVSIHDVFASKEQGLEKLLSYDWYRRGCFIDHFFGSEAEPGQLLSARYAEEGDFVNQGYSVSHRTVAGDTVISFSREGHVWYEEKRAGITVEKEFVIQALRPEAAVSYLITNRDEFPVNLHFGVEFNFGFPNLTSQNVSYTIDGEVPSRFKHLGGISVLDSVSEFGLHNGDDNFRLRFLLQKKSTLWRMPIYTVSLSEEGFEKVQQGICIVPSWKMRLAPNENWQLKMIVKFMEVDPNQAKRAATVSLARA